MVLPKSELSFIGDVEKMGDFPGMTKKEFLWSYSYLTNEEYDATMIDYIKMDLYHTLWNFVGMAYVKGIYEKIADDVVSDICECSEVYFGKMYNNDDMKLAIGRALSKQLGLISD